WTSPAARPSPGGASSTWSPRSRPRSRARRSRPRLGTGSGSSSSCIARRTGRSASPPHRLFAAPPGAAERLRNLSRLGELAEAWTRREPGGSNRDFVRYLVAVSGAGVAPVGEQNEPDAGGGRG